LVRLSIRRVCTLPTLARLAPLIRSGPFFPPRPSASDGRGLPFASVDIASRRLVSLKRRPFLTLKGLPMRRIALLISATLCMAALSSGCTSFSSGNQSYDIDWSKIGSGEQVISPVNVGEPWQGDAVEAATGQ
jgi:hypothetical protein